MAKNQMTCSLPKQSVALLISSYHPSYHTVMLKHSHDACFCKYLLKIKPITFSQIVACPSNNIVVDLLVHEILVLDYYYVCFLHFWKTENTTASIVFWRENKR